MFERYTEPARRVLFFARFEASTQGGISIETEHLLLGLIREHKGITGRIFARFGVSPEDLRRDIEKRRPVQQKTPLSIEIPFSADTKRVLHFAAEEADRLLHNHIGSEHLLLGLLREEKSLAADILNGHGMTLNGVREEIVVLLNDRTLSDRSEGEIEPGAGGFGVVTQFTRFTQVAPDLALKLAGYTTPDHQLHRNVLFDQLFSDLPKESQAKVQIYNAEIAPGGYTNWHCHNGATFFIALQGVFEAEFQEGILVRAKAGDVYSEPIGKFHRGHNPHPSVPYLCIGVAITPPDKDHVTNVDSRPW